MDQDILGRNEKRLEQPGLASPKQAKKSLTNSSKRRNRSQQQQQPGRYLCVDTRKEQVYAPRVRPHSSYTHNFSSPNTRLKHFSKDVHRNLPTKNLKTLQNRTVQPDSHCKFKTTLAIDYVRDIVEENVKNSRPRSRRNSLKKNGHLKPLLSTGQPSLEPNVKKCLGIQNDRQKKIITLDDGLEVREEVFSPSSTRFSSAAKNISQNILTVDLRKLSLASDQDGSIASDNGVTCEQRPGFDSGGFRKNPKSRSIIMSRKNIESKFDGIDRNQQDDNKSTGVRHRSDLSHNHTIDDIDSDQGIDDTIGYSDKYGDHVDLSSRQLDLSSRQLDYNRADIGEIDYIDDIRDDSSLKHDLRGFIIDDMINTSDDIGDDFDEEDTTNHQSHEDQNAFKESDRKFRGFEENMIENNRTKTNQGLKSSKPERKLIYVNGNLMSTDDNSCVTMNEKPNPKILEETFSKPDKPTDENQEIYQKPQVEYQNIDRAKQKTSVGPGSPSSTNSTTPFPCFPDHNRKPTNEIQGIYQKHQTEHPNIDRPQQNTNVRLGSPSFANSTNPFPSFPDHDRKPTDENQGTYQEPQMENPNIDAPRQNTSAPPLASSSNSTIPSLNPSTPDQDSIQVKDIWKALVDGGYDISREEISKYKVNSTKRRIRSAPPRRRSSQNSTIVRDVPTRAKSAVNREERLREKECFEDLDEEGDSGEIRKNNPTFGGFFQEQTSATKLKPSKESLYNDRSSLEVVAVSKPVTKLARKKIPPVPPLNFQINTMPKSEHFFYFAYGLNMNQKRLEIQLRCQTGVRYWSLLFGFRLLFNKKGSAEGGVGFPNVVHEPGFSVEGCVYELSLDYLPLLDICVGFPKHYSRMILPVWLCNSLEPAELGVAQHCVPAVVYVAQDEWIASDPTTLDTSFTLKQCTLGTDLLSSYYKQFLDSFDITVTDGNPKL